MLRNVDSMTNTPQNIETKAQPKQPSRPPQRVRRKRSIDLGDTRSESFGEWLYGHRIGLIVVIVCFLIGGTFIATARVDVEIPPIEYIIEFVDEEPTLEDIEKAKQERDRLQEEINRRLAAVEQVRNLQSNEAAEEGGSPEEVTYDSETQQMMNKVASDMATNRGDYESGMREVDGIGKGGTGSGSGGKRGNGKDNNFSSGVTVEYNIHYFVGNKKVARSARSSLYKPSYRAKGGGVVVVEVKINRDGKVLSAVVIESTNSELNSYARNAALNIGTHFNIDPNAPNPNVGTITYTFVAQ